MLISGSKISQFRCRDLLRILSLCLCITLLQTKESKKESKDFGPGHHFVAAPTAHKNSTGKAKSAEADNPDDASKEKPPPPKKNPVNIPLIAGLAGGGAVAVGGAVAAIVAASQAQQHQGQQKVSVPTPSVKTALTLAIQQGATVIEVADQSGFALGDVIQIDGEFNRIKGFSSIILDHPLGHAHAAGAVVKLVAAAQGVRQALTTPSIDKVLGGSFTEPPTSTSHSVRTRPKVDKVREVDEDNGSTGVLMIITGLLICAAAMCAVSLAMFCASKHRLSRSRDFDDDEEYSQVDDEEEDEEEESEEEDLYKKSKRKWESEVAMPPMQADPYAMHSS